MELAREGCHIVVAARTEQETDPKMPGTIFSTAEEVRSLGVRALPVRTDVTDEESVRAMVQTTLDEFGRIDILVNNAGIMFPGRLWEIPAKRWDLVVRVNVRGPVICCQAVLPHMIERRQGVIINISSVVADQRGAGNISYSVTKQALRKFSEGLAEEVKEHSIKVFALSPEGLVITPGTMYHRLDEQVPSGPLVESSEAMGKAAVFLCSDEARSLSGQHFYSRALLRERGLWHEPQPSTGA
jgi:NAD(P)-dependent dehydrogenase (short-subunit alcohol dehydrogenase family)